MTYPMCDYSRPDDELEVNYHPDENSVTKIPVTDDRVIAFLSGGGTIAAYITPEPYTPPVPDPVPALYAVAQITISDGEISGFEVASKFAGGFVLDTGSYYIFFAETQPDANYLAKAYDGGLVRAYVSAENKATDYFIITVTDFDGNPVDTSTLSIEVIRVN